MTYLEKLKKDCTGLSEKSVIEISLHMCPHYFYRCRTHKCTVIGRRPRDMGKTCRECWNEQIPEYEKEDMSNA